MDISFAWPNYIKQMYVQMKTKKLQLLIRKYGADFGIVMLLGFVGLQGTLKAIERGSTWVVPFSIVAWLVLVFLFIRKARLSWQD